VERAPRSGRCVIVGRSDQGGLLSGTIGRSGQGEGRSRKTGRASTLRHPRSLRPAAARAGDVRCYRLTIEDVGRRVKTGRRYQRSECVEALLVFEAGEERNESG